MQQADFRQLLGSSRPSASDAAAPAAYITAEARRRDLLGAGSKPAFAPRKADAKGKGKADEGGTGAGKERRAPAAVEEKLAPALDDTRGTLARPTRGLDLSQLEHDRLAKAAELEAAAEDDLEEAFAAPVAVPVAAAPARKSRDELLAELAERQSRARGGDLALAKADGRFKRVGERPAASATTEASAGAAPAKVVKRLDPKTGKVKTLRKKKRDTPPPVAPEPTTSVEPPTSAAPSTSAAPAASAPPVSAPLAEPEPEPVALDDGDIFGEAGDYDPFASADEDNDERSAPERPAMRPAVALFDDGDAEIRADPIAAPALPRPASVAAPASARTGDDGDADDGDEEQGPAARLQGFADSADVRSLLAVDDGLIKDERKRERKEKRRALAAGEEPAPPAAKRKKELTDKDKLNRDFLAYQAYEAKRGGGGGGGAATGAANAGA